MPVVGPAGCGTLLGRGDWEAKRACSKCPLGRSVPGAPHTSEHLILDPEHALYLTCPHPVLTYFLLLCGKFGLSWGFFFFCILLLVFGSSVCWAFCLSGFGFLVLGFF